MSMRKKGQVALIVIALILLVLIVFSVYKSGILTGLAVFGKEVEITRSVEKIEQNETNAVYHVVLDVKTGGNKALSIREKVNMPECSWIEDISDNGVEKYDNVIEWFLADSSLGINASKLENKKLVYYIREESCWEY